LTDEKRCFGCMEDHEEILPCPACGYHEGDVDDVPLQLSPGTVLNNTYLIGRVLGQGGFGITYLGWDLNLRVKLAIKEYFPQQYVTRLSGENKVSAFSGSLSNHYTYGLDKFLQEARILAQFEGHPNIVAVRNYFQANGTAYLVMSYVEGVTLKNHLKLAGGNIHFDQVLKLIKPVFDALKEVHKTGILHRDISPDNIFINRKGQVVLLDFGAARQAIGEKEKSISIILKPGYAPEEQYRRRGVQGPWTDIYAVAATIYFLVTSIQPPDALERLVEDTLIPPSRMGVAINAFQEQALLKALAVRAAERFHTVEAFQEALFTESSAPGEDQASATPRQVLVETFGRETSQTALKETNKQASSQQMTSVLTPRGEEPLAKPLPHSEVLVNTRKKISPLALGGAALLTLVILGYLAIRLISGPTEPVGQQPETAQGEPGIISTAVDEPTLEEGTIPMDGGVYSGQLLGGEAHGYGVWTDSDGSFYEGEFAYGMANGQGVMIWPDGEQYDGRWENDEMHGYGVWIGPDGSTYEGDFAYNMFNGLGTITWPDGERYEGFWANDLMHGEGVYIWPDGERYEGEFVYDKMHGWGRYTYADGSVIEGIWEDDEYIGDLR
jgi:serine/threonine protein kinase